MKLDTAAEDLATRHAEEEEEEGADTEVEAEAACDFLGLLAKRGADAEEEEEEEAAALERT